MGVMVMLLKLILKTVEFNTFSIQKKTAFGTDFVLLSLIFIDMLRK